jgi:hypothetical protein
MNKQKKKEKEKRKRKKRILINLARFLEHGCTHEENH